MQSLFIIFVAPLHLPAACRLLCHRAGVLCVGFLLSSLTLKSVREHRGGVGGVGCRGVAAAAAAAAAGDTTMKEPNHHH